VQVPEGKKTTKVTVMTPDDRNDEDVHSREPGREWIYCPLLSTYDLVVMKLE